ncbi:methyltransferase family protein [Streptomyces sp. NPDC002779]|uniref:methyltransferase family protein n=1 Tax=Streptomyces sp. NPDC002779 TaxID=3364664 RepID=UPI00367DF392
MTREDIARSLVGLTAVLWFWSEAKWVIRQRATSDRVVIKESRSFFALVISYGAAQMGAFGLMWFFPSLQIADDWSTLMIAAMPLAWTGLALRQWSVHTLGDFFRAKVTVQRDHDVVRSGPYRYIRHPSYAGGLMTVMAMALIFNHLAAWIVVVGAVFTGALYRIRVEDEVLCRHLGSDYRHYAAHTSRLIPGIW